MIGDDLPRGIASVDTGKVKVSAVAGFWGGG